MRPLEGALSGTFEVFNYEFDGHGSKSLTKDLFSISNFVIQLDSFIQELGEEVHIFGYSMGGFIALISASRGNQAIKTISTLGTKMSWSQEIAENEIKNLDPDLIKEKVPKFFKALEQRHGDHWVEVLGRTSDFMASLGFHNPLQEETMGQVKCPVQLLIGERDQMVSVEETKLVSQWIPEATLKVLSEVQHPIEKLDTKYLAALIADFSK